MKRRKTNRGFGLITFKDRYDVDCSIQKSSLATEDCIWLGIDKVRPEIMANKVYEGGTGWIDYEIPEDVLLNSRMHLNKEMCKDLVKVLKKFIKTGEI